MDAPDRPLFLAAKPGLEPWLAEEARDLGLADLAEVPGGVEAAGGWPEVMRANLWLRGAERVLWRIASFRAMHPAQLDKRARKVDWRAWLPRGAAVAVEATCRKSRIYHQGAARSRVAGAIEAAGMTIAEKAALRVMVRIEDDLCTISLDTSGAALHRRGWKEAVGKAPMRETMAALFLRAAGYRGAGPVVDPMCGSGTIPIEAACIAAGLAPGRARGFAFERFAGFDRDLWASMSPGVPELPASICAYGSDRDAGVIAMAAENADRAGVSSLTSFERMPVSDVAPPEGAPGLMIANPPYGGRIGNRKLLYGLYGAFGAVARERFAGWRVAFVTSDDGLARSTGLELSPGPRVAHGGLTVRLWQTR